jgi:hypothetical protein
MVDGHEIPEVEHVVERHPRYTVAEKENHQAEIAEDSDPRTS